MNTFATKLREQYLDVYATNDTAHNVDHIDGVYENALAINEQLELGLDSTYLAILAYTHDLFARHRDNHHELAYHHLLTTNEWYMRGMPDPIRIMLAGAVREHRASYRGTYTSVYSEVLASADRGSPTNLLDKLERSYKYGISKLTLTPTVATIHAFQHMHEKFGRKGYAQYPSLYKRLYGEQLEELWSQIDRLDVPSQKDVLTDLSMASLLNKMLK